MQANLEMMMNGTLVPTERVVHSELVVVAAAGMHIDTEVVVVVHEQVVAVVAGMQTVNAAEAEAFQAVGRYSAAVQNKGIVHMAGFEP
jgi:hypothetical protein